MLQNIQNFSELTAIDTAGALIVTLKLKQHGHVRYGCWINNITVNLDTIVLSFDLFDSIRLQIEINEFEEGTSGIEVVEFSINGHEVLPRYQHLASRPTNYLDQKGNWYLEIPSPFYTWYHEISGQGFIA